MKVKRRPAPRVLNKRTDAIPDRAVYVGRPSPWGNPFTTVAAKGRGGALEAFRAWVWAPERAALRARARRELRGRDLVCWCAPKPCHADIWLVIANHDEPEVWEAPHGWMVEVTLAAPDPAGYRAVILDSRDRVIATSIPERGPVDFENRRFQFVFAQPITLTFADALTYRIGVQGPSGAWIPYEEASWIGRK